HYIGEQTAYHDPEQHFFFRPEFVDELRHMAPAAITRPERYCALIAQGDELLDWREMAAHYAGAHALILEGSDHGLSDFDHHLPFLLRFLSLCD
ncbi:MAG: esterase, partial [Burkholderiales bacterium]|nr:esterase [Burkholderiales bacterium]